MDIEKQIKLLRDSETVVLDYLVWKVNKGDAYIRAKDVVKSLDMSRQFASSILHTLEVGLIIEREREIFYKLSNRTMKHYFT